MNDSNGNEGINLLARTLQGRMKSLDDLNPPVVDFATIQPNFSMLADSFPVEIPQSDWFICRSLVLTGEEQPRKVAPGDRVLVAWVGTHPCVIDIIYPASRI